METKTTSAFQSDKVGKQTSFLKMMEKLEIRYRKLNNLDDKKIVFDHNISSMIGMSSKAFSATKNRCAVPIDCLRRYCKKNDLDLKEFHIGLDTRIVRKNKTKIGDICIVDGCSTIIDKDTLCASTRNKDGSIKSLRSSCKGCITEYNRKRRALTNKGKPTHCKCGVFLTDENIVFVKYKNKDGIQKIGKKYTCKPCNKIKYDKENKVRNVKRKLPAKSKPSPKVRRPIKDKKKIAVESIKKALLITKPIVKKVVETKVDIKMSPTLTSVSSILKSKTEHIDDEKARLEKMQMDFIKKNKKKIQENRDVQPMSNVCVPFTGQTESTHTLRGNKSLINFT